MGGKPQGQRVELDYEDIYALYVNNYFYDSAQFVEEEDFDNCSTGRAHSTKRRLVSRLQSLERSEPDEFMRQWYVAGFNYAFCNLLFDANKIPEARAAVSSIMASEPAYVFLERLLEPLGTSVLAECERESAFYSPAEIDSAILERFAPSYDPFIHEYLDAECIAVVHTPSKRVGLVFDHSSLCTMGFAQSEDVHLPKLDIRLDSFTYKENGELHDRIYRLMGSLDGPLAALHTEHPKLFNYFAWRYIMQQAGAAIDESSILKPCPYKPITRIGL
jgi:hypothetical protein